MIDVIEGIVAINVRLSGAQQIQVGAVDERDFILNSSAFSICGASKKLKPSAADDGVVFHGGDEILVDRPEQSGHSVVSQGPLLHGSVG